MKKKLCLECGVTSWHNPMKPLDAYRCCYCGHPPQGRDMRLAYNRELMGKQISRARVLGLK